MKLIISEKDEFFDTKLRMLKYLKKAIKKFVKNAGPGYRTAIRELEKIPIELTISRRLKNTYGIANTETKYKKVKTLLITLTHEIDTYSPKLIYQIVSHELAHCIDFIVRGDSFHDEPWKKIHRIMGGEATTFIEEP